jgi:hypothetical protein
VRLGHKVLPARPAFKAPLGQKGQRDPLESRALQEPTAPTARMGSVPTKFGWRKAIRVRRQTTLLRSLPADPQDPQGRLGPQGRQEPPARKDLLGPLDQRVLQEPKVLWVLPEQPVRKAPQGRQGQQEPTGRTVSP